jgi:hypothetical protein
VNMNMLLVRQKCVGIIGYYTERNSVKMSLMYAAAKFVWSMQLMV